VYQDFEYGLEVMVLESLCDTGYLKEL
jgi:hypothetical protein